MEYKGYASLSTIADKLLRHPLMRGISYEAIIDYAIDFMRIVQCGGFFDERCTVIKIEDYKGNEKIINIYFICKILTNLCK